jgi:hypothetical protein
MPSALLDLQAAFAAHLVGADRPDLAAMVVGDTIPAAARLRVYRHHVFESLGTALATTFPTVRALVGNDFFRGLARTFIHKSPPLQPVLAEYGAGFPTFIADYQPGRELPYLADTARLDWALNLACQAPASGRLTAAELAAIPAERLPEMRLVLAPGAVLVSSPYPLDRIWSASQPHAVEAAVDLGGGGVRLLVLRRSDDAAFVSLTQGEATFVARLVDGERLEAASTVALQAEAAFDLSACFARLIGLGAFAAAQ